MQFIYQSLFGDSQSCIIRRWRSVVLLFADKNNSSQWQKKKANRARSTYAAGTLSCLCRSRCRQGNGWFGNSCLDWYLRDTKTNVNSSPLYIARCCGHLFKAWLASARWRMCGRWSPSHICFLYTVTCLCLTVATGVRRSCAPVSDKRGWRGKSQVVFHVLASLPLEEEPTGTAGHKREAQPLWLI